MGCVSICIKYENAYVYIYRGTYKYARKHIHTHICMYVCIHIYTYTCIQIYIPIYISIYLFTYMYIYICIYIYTHTHLYTCTCVHICTVYKYVCTNMLCHNTAIVVYSRLHQHDFMIVFFGLDRCVSGAEKLSCLNATQSNTMQHTITHSNTLHHTARRECDMCGGAVCWSVTCAVVPACVTRRVMLFDSYFCRRCTRGFI